MSDSPDLTTILVKLSLEVGATANGVQALNDKFDTHASTTAAQLLDLSGRVDALEAHRDVQAGADAEAHKAAADSVAKVDRNIKLLGACLAAVTLAETALRFIPLLGR